MQSQEPFGHGGLKDAWVWRLTDDQWKLLVKGIDISPAAKGQVDYAIRYFRLISVICTDHTLHRRLKRLLDDAKRFTISTESKLNSVVNRVDQLLSDESFFDSVQRGTIDHEPLSDQYRDRFRSDLAEALKVFPQRSHDLIACLDLAYDRVHFKGGPVKGGDARGLIFALALILEENSKHKVTLSKTRGRAAWNFITRGCQVAVDKTDLAIKPPTITAIIKEMVEERRFTDATGFTPIDIIELLESHGVAEFNEDALFHFGDRAEWIRRREAAKLWRQKVKPLFKKLSLDSEKGASTRSHAVGV